jgi:hypothetical protein
VSESDSAPPVIQKWDDTAVIPPGLDWHGCANPSFFEKIITLFQRIFDMRPQLL